MEIHLALSTILGCMHVHSTQQTLWIRAEEVVSWQAVQVCDLGVAGSYHDSAEFRSHIDMVSKAPGFLFICAVTLDIHCGEATRSQLRFFFFRSVSDTATRESRKGSLWFLRVTYRDDG